MSRSSLFLCCEMKRETKLLKQNPSGVGSWSAIYWKGGFLSSLAASQDFLKHQVCTGTRVANLLWSERAVERDCLVGMSTAVWFSDPVGYVRYLPIGYDCAEQHYLSIARSLSLPVSGPRRPNVPVLSLCQPGVSSVDIWMSGGFGGSVVLAPVPLSIAASQPCWGAADEEEQQSSQRCITAFLSSYVETAEVTTLDQCF